MIETPITPATDVEIMELFDAATEVEEERRDGEGWSYCSMGNDLHDDIWLYLRVAQPDRIRRIVARLALAEQRLERLTPPACLRMDGVECQVIDWTELSRRGVLERINRDICHPMGLAVYRDTESGVSFGAMVAPEGQDFSFLELTPNKDES